MEMNGGFLVTKIKQLGDRIFEKILSEKNIDAFNGAQGRILYVLWQEDGISIRSLSTKCGLAITSLTTMLERMENQGLILSTSFWSPSSYTKLVRPLSETAWISVTISSIVMVYLLKPYASNFFTNRVALCPPKPRELEIAQFTSICTPSPLQ